MRGRPDRVFLSAQDVWPLTPTAMNTWLRFPGRILGMTLPELFRVSPLDAISGQTNKRLIQGHTRESIKQNYCAFVSWAACFCFSALAFKAKFTGISIVPPTGLPFFLPGLNFHPAAACSVAACNSAGASVFC